MNTRENVVVTENVHEAAALLRPTFGSWGNQNLRESLLLGQEIGRRVPELTRKDSSLLSLGYLSP